MEHKINICSTGEPKSGRTIRELLVMLLEIRLGTLAASTNRHGKVFV